MQKQWKNLAADISGDFEMEFKHLPVLASECIESLNINPNGIYIDCTAGGAGHSRLIAQKLENGRLIALDRDPEAVQVATQRLKDYNATVVNKNYSELLQALSELEIDKADGILMDLGVSSYQLDCAERGFSYHADAMLDMRMSKNGISAADIVNTYSFEELRKIIFEYGEEKNAPAIARAIVNKRETEKIQTTLQLAEIIKANVPASYRREKNPCKKTFQAIRIAVNNEFEHLSIGLDAAFESLKIGGRLAVITFHSIEDRIVKKRFAKFCTGCTCPPEFPQCVCGKLPEGKLVNKKPIIASDDELEQNLRSRSAKLRVIERIR